MNPYLHHQYVETNAKFKKFSARLERSQGRGEFQKLSKRKQHFLLSRIRKLWEKLRLLEVQLKISTVGISMALLLMVNNAAAQQFVEAPHRNPLPSPTIFGGRMELLDIDGDGDLDILTRSYHGDILHFQNVGTAAVPDFEKVPDSENPFTELRENENFYLSEIRDAADIDGDGDIDLLQEGSILLNTGSNEAIRYEQGEDYIPGIDKYRYKLGDIDGDGDLDVISFDQGEVVVNENIGNASTFTISETETILPVSGWNTTNNSVRDVEVADLDQDGDLDLLLTSRYYDNDDYRYKTLLVSNTGTSAVPAFTQAGEENNPYASIGDSDLHIGDMDGDGDFDLIIESYPEMFSFYKLSESGLEENRDVIPEFYDGILLPYSYTPPQFVDFDGDGDLDIFAGEDECIYFEQVLTGSQSKFIKRGVKEFPFNEDNTRGYPLSFSDIDGDGDVDVLYAESVYDPGSWDYYYVFSLYENTGTAGNPVYEEKEDAGIENQEDFFAPSFVDIDSDGDMDLFMSGWDKLFEESHLCTKFYENTGNDHFVFTEKNGFNDNPLLGVSDINFPDLEYAYLQFSDLDDDGDFDVMFSGYYGKIYFLENVGNAVKARYIDRSASSPVWGLFAGYYGSLSLADVDNDGDDDLFIHEYYGMFTTYYENSPDMVLRVPKTPEDGILKLFPNPVMDELSLEFPGTVEGPLHYQILGVDGRSIQSGELQNQVGNNQQLIPAESLHPGYYLLKINSKQQVFTSKFLKQ